MAEVSHFQLPLVLDQRPNSDGVSTTKQWGPKQDLIMGTTSHTLPRSGTDSIIRY